MSKILVCNTGPLIAFSLINRLDILRSIFDVIAISEEVRHEVLQGGGAGGKLAMWKEPEWISDAVLKEALYQAGEK